MSVSDTNKNRGAHGDSSFMLGGLPSSSENHHTFQWVVSATLDKAIEHGKEKRKQYRGSKAIDCTCRNHGSCDWCRENRTHKFRDKQPPEMDDLVRRGDVIAALHSGNIDCGLVEPETHRKLRELSRKIDAEIMRVPAERSKNLYLCESLVATFGGAEAVEAHLGNGWHLVIVPDHVPKEE